mmetsp:Transcript_9475/g.37004  ORF Transcript_9475/g.37004 Transcript_9475/m.37004 type:complete len:222 (-) Transcript_9475:907-1572(-)
MSGVCRAMASVAMHPVASAAPTSSATSPGQAAAMAASAASSRPRRPRSQRERIEGSGPALEKAATTSAPLMPEMPDRSRECSRRSAPEAASAPRDAAVRARQRARDRCCRPWHDEATASTVASSTAAAQPESTRRCKDGLARTRARRWAAPRRLDPAKSRSRRFTRRRSGPSEVGKAGPEPAAASAAAVGKAAGSKPRASKRRTAGPCRRMRAASPEVDSS